MDKSRRIIRLLPLAAVACMLAACATDSQSTRQPLRPVSACPDLNHSPEMYTPDDKTVVMKSGPNYYRVDLMNKCGRLSGSTISFKLAHGMSGARRLCGEVGDELINVDGMHCGIRSVTRINKQQFADLQAQSRAR